jgi:hypothetical protein
VVAAVPSPPRALFHDTPGHWRPCGRRHRTRGPRSLGDRGPSFVREHTASRERIPTFVLDEHEDIAHVVATRIAALIRERQAAGRPVVLGLATGSTPIGVYRELIRMHREEGLSFRNVVTFNLDEYYPMAPDSIHSYHRFMWENLFDHVDVQRANVHIPRGDIPREDVETWCKQYERDIKAAEGSISRSSASARRATSDSTSPDRARTAGRGSCTSTP